MIRSYKAYLENNSSMTLNITKMGSWMQDYDFEHYYDGLSALFQNFKERIKYVMSESREILGVEETKVMRDRNGGLTRVDILFDETSAENIAKDKVLNKVYGNLIRRLRTELHTEGIAVDDHFGCIQLSIIESKIKSLE